MHWIGPKVAGAPYIRLRLAETSAFAPISSGRRVRLRLQVAKDVAVVLETKRSAVSLYEDGDKGEISLSTDDASSRMIVYRNAVNSRETSQNSPTMVPNHDERHRQRVPICSIPPA